MEGINQTSPNYKKPIPFSKTWWDYLKYKKDIKNFKIDWGIKQ